ncbi:ABC transporter substrate-binding protein [Ktedonospora formicarum]|uniref:Sugar ABC transporter substrate-binding protein n=1 Tax=Ktedonospora formicarum TaxID=2778364 RepID=A0A8J3HZV1_9CHLR|nr:extracellular solute-binding protein [Ktedonospora formicarum]GHO46221.1 sugar ABC transporter substrate-binding protein [Ktedonospora formicarum]
MSRIYSRRQAVQLGVSSLAGLTVLGLTSCGSPTAKSGTTKLQLYFWGSASRDKLTKKAISLFQGQHSNITINSHFTGFDAYWDKLNTQVAGGTMPDLFQMDMRYVAQYVKQGLLLDLTSSIDSKAINLSDFDQTLLESSKASGKVYGIPMGGNYHSWIYDTEMLKDAGGTPPTDDLDWNGFSDYMTKLSKQLKKGVSASNDASGEIATFEVWLRQHGKELYTNDGQVNFTADDVAEWFSFWDKMRKAGACVPPDVQASLSGTSGAANSTLIHGKAIFNVTHSNLFDSYQTLTKHALELYPIPKGSQPGSYLKPSMLISISSKTKYTDDSAKFIDFITNDPKGVQALGLDRGVPGGTKARESLTSQLTTSQKIVMTFFDRMAQGSRVKGKQVLDPPGAGDVQTALTRDSQAVSFGKTSISAGAKSFLSDAQKAIAQAK